MKNARKKGEITLNQNESYFDFCRTAFLVAAEHFFLVPAVEIFRKSRV
jgi:hypothetical protein